MSEEVELLIREGLAQEPRVAYPVYLNVEYSALRALVEKAICVGMEKERKRTEDYILVGSEEALVGATAEPVECLTGVETGLLKQAA